MLWSHVEEKGLLIKILLSDLFLLMPNGFQASDSCALKLDLWYRIAYINFQQNYLKYLPETIWQIANNSGTTSPWIPLTIFIAAVPSPWGVIRSFGYSCFVPYVYQLRRFPSYDIAVSVSYSSEFWHAPAFRNAGRFKSMWHSSFVCTSVIFKYTEKVHLRNKEW